MRHRAPPAVTRRFSDTHTHNSPDEVNRHLTQFRIAAPLLEEEGGIAYKTQWAKLAYIGISKNYNMQQGEYIYAESEESLLTHTHTHNFILYIICE